MSNGAPVSGPRREVFNALKGIGILEVVIHHCLSHGARKYTELHSVEWWVLRTLNKVLHFAIPLFLLVSAALLTQSLMKRTDWKRFALRRACRTLWPYLLWSMVYVLFRVMLLRTPGDIATVTADLPLFGHVTGPRLLVDVRGLLEELVSGKAYFHLYFLLVLLQLAAVLPFVFLAMRRRAMSFGWVLALAGALQVGAYVLQSQVLHVPSPASMILWYIPSLLVGVWIGLDWDRWTGQWNRVRTPLMAGATLGLAAYLTASFLLEVGRFVPSLAYNTAFTLYTVCVGLLLFGFAPAIAGSRMGLRLANLGQLSLPIFLIHPLVLYVIGGPRLTGLIDRLPVPVLWTTLFVIIVSYGIARLTVALWLDWPLFGQRLKQVGVAPTQASLQKV